MDSRDIADKQSAYYGRLFDKYGPAVEAVASSNQVLKSLRYEKLSYVFHRDLELTLHDVGFGLGHYYEVLKAQFPEKKIRYSGSEVTPAFVSYCEEKHPEARFVRRNLADRVYEDRYDYLVLGGTLYHLAGTPKAEFVEYTKRMIANAFQMCRRGISFNLMTVFCDYYYDHLFYGDLTDIVPYISNNLSRFFVIDHAYPLYEFTIHVYRQEYMEKVYRQPEFGRYF